MTFKNLKFEELVTGLSRKKDQEKLVDYFTENHADKVDVLVKSLAGADEHKIAGIVKIFNRLNGAVHPLLVESVLGQDIAGAQAAMKVSSQMNEVGVDIGLKVIEHPDPSIANRGAEILRNMGFRAVPFLHEKLKVKDPSKRGLAILMELDPDSSEFFKTALEDMLKTEDQILSRYAIDAAASIGDFALPLLLELIGDPDPFAQQNATNTLIKIGEPIVVELIEELDNPSGLVQQNVMRALKEIGLPAVPALKEALSSNSQLIKQNATAVLNSAALKPSRGLLSRFRR